MYGSIIWDMAAKTTSGTPGPGVLGVVVTGPKTFLNILNLSKNLLKVPPQNNFRHSWVSWPLARLVQGAPIEEVSLRFRWTQTANTKNRNTNTDGYEVNSARLRNWNTTFSLSPHPGSSSSGSRASSPRNEKSPYEEERWNYELWWMNRQTIPTGH